MMHNHLNGMGSPVPLPLGWCQLYSKELPGAWIVRIVGMVFRGEVVFNSKVVSGKKEAFMDKFKKRQWVFFVAILFLVGLGLSACATTKQIETLEAKVQEAMDKADQAMAESQSAKGAAKAEASRAESAALRAERAAAAAESSAERAEAAAKKCEEICEKVSAK
jgi:hypothetical protein